MAGESISCGLCGVEIGNLPLKVHYQVCKVVNANYKQLDTLCQKLGILVTICR